MKLDQDFFGAGSDVVAVEVPGREKPVHLRYPSFGEWHELATAHQALAEEKKTPSADLITKTLAYCLADENGKRLLASNGEAKQLLDCSPRLVMHVYKRAWETVLKNDDESIGAIEKNSEASRG
jgi:hypothetical protein